MNQPTGKFLLDFVNGFGHQQLFFLLWAGVAGFFVYLLYSYNKKSNRRNFRDDRGPQMLMDAKRLKSDSNSKLTVKKESSEQSVQMHSSKVEVKKSYPK